METQQQLEAMFEPSRSLSFEPQLEALLNELEAAIQEELATTSKDGPHEFGGRAFTSLFTKAKGLLRNTLNSPELPEDHRVSLELAREELQGLEKQIQDIVFLRRNTSPGYQMNEANRLLTKPKAELTNRVREAITLAVQLESPRLPN